MIVRAVAAAAAAVACAWFVLGARQAHELNVVRSTLSASGNLTAAQARAADSELDSAATLNPDRTVDVLRGEVATAAGEMASAQRILLAVTRAEPKNLEAWVALAGAAANDRALFLRAYAAARRLEPRVPGAS